MSRRKAREMALQALFQLDFNAVEKDVALQNVFAEREVQSEAAQSYAETLVKGTIANLPAIDDTINKISNEWKLERMAGVDRNIVRLAIFELQFSEENLPQSVVINEAVELAKAFGSEDSGRFVNGILGSIFKNKI
ncbi:MAG: transcription antitermination factor NusB [Pelosinus sp.]|nr:transcription antitermination factor NusB [Pelosinus sp.]